MYSLQELGWSDFFSRQLRPRPGGNTPDSESATVDSESAFRGWVPARVAEENRELYRVFTERGEFLAELSGKLRHVTTSRAGLPAVGDWVIAEPRMSEHRATIHRVLQRKGKFSRKMAGRRTEEQVLAANVDVVFLVSSLNREFNPRRMERYLALACENGAFPVVVLNKCDLCENAEAFRTEAEDAAIGARVVLASATRGDGLAELHALLRSSSDNRSVGNVSASGGEQSCITAALLGSSGVGKSSLVNALTGALPGASAGPAGDAPGGEPLVGAFQGAERSTSYAAGPLATQAVREGDDKGRHTTTSRQMILVPGGGVLIDTPGMRELQLWDAADGIGRAFGDIQELAGGCKFRDCSHDGEPGCAVRAAVQAEALDAERVESFHKLEREERFLEAKQDASLRSQRTKQLRKLMKSVKRFYRDRGR